MSAVSGNISPGVAAQPVVDHRAQITRIEEELSSLGTRLACGICFNQYVNSDTDARSPMTLQCGHTWCFTCLSQIPRCSTCRVPIETSHRNLDTADFAALAQSVSYTLEYLRGLQAALPAADEVVAATEVATTGWTWISSPAFKNSISKALGAINASAIIIAEKQLDIRFDSAEAAERGATILSDVGSLWGIDFNREVPSSLNFLVAGRWSH